VTCAEGDLNFNGVVDFADLVILARNFGRVSWNLVAYKSTLTRIAQDVFEADLSPNRGVQFLLTQKQAARPAAASTRQVACTDRR